MHKLMFRMVGRGGEHSRMAKAPHSFPLYQTPSLDAALREQSGSSFPELQPSPCPFLQEHKEGPTVT